MMVKERACCARSDLWRQLPVGSFNYRRFTNKRRLSRNRNALGWDRPGHWKGGVNFSFSPGKNSLVEAREVQPHFAKKSERSISRLLLPVPSLLLRHASIGALDEA